MQHVLTMRVNKILITISRRRACRCLRGSRGGAADTREMPSSQMRAPRLPVTPVAILSRGDLYAPPPRHEAFMRKPGCGNAMSALLLPGRRERATRDS